MPNSRLPHWNRRRQKKDDSWVGQDNFKSEQRPESELKDVIYG